MSHEQFNALVARAGLAHLVLVGDRGTTSLHSCTFEWSYDGLSLSIECTHHPFWADCHKINEKLAELLHF